tara:strand:- start:660 stop:842 length:183 start_codon:yes stop_codon:yes gene_type:complete
MLLSGRNDMWVSSKLFDWIPFSGAVEVDNEKPVAVEVEKHYTNYSHLHLNNNVYIDGRKA